MFTKDSRWKGSTAPGIACSLYRDRSLARLDSKIIEVDDAVGLGPDADAAGYRPRQGVSQVESAVQIALDRCSFHGEPQVVPLAGRCRRVPYPLHRTALAVLELPQNQVVLERVCPQGQVVAVRLQVEQNPGSLVDAAFDALEPHGNLAFAEVFDAGRHGVGEVGVGGDVVEKLGITLAVNASRPVGDVGRGLPLAPAPSVDHQNSVVAVDADDPVANDGHKALGL